MSGPGECAQVRPELGVYVLGAIAPADRAMVDRHLASCPRCRDDRLKPNPATSHW
jgi:anti-sigma factor RsiW